MAENPNDNTWNYTLKDVYLHILGGNIVSWRYPEIVLLLDV